IASGVAHGSRFERGTGTGDGAATAGGERDPTWHRAARRGGNAGGGERTRRRRRAIMGARRRRGCNECQRRDAWRRDRAEEHACATRGLVRRPCVAHAHAGERRRNGSDRAAAVSRGGRVSTTSTTSIPASALR